VALCCIPRNSAVAEPDKSECCKNIAGVNAMNRPETSSQSLFLAYLRRTKNTHAAR